MADQDGGMGYDRALHEKIRLTGQVTPFEITGFDKTPG